MAKFKGRVEHSDLEGGYWTLHAEDGQTYKLEGGGADLLREGARVEIDGHIEAAMGIGFGTPVLAVSKYKLVDKK